MHPLAAILITLGFVVVSLIVGYYLSFLIVVGPMVQCTDVACPMIHGLLAWPLTSVVVLIAVLLVYRRWR